MISSEMNSSKLLADRGVVALLIAVTVFTLFCLWLGRKPVDEEVAEAILSYEMLVLEGKYEEASSKIMSVLPEGDGPLNKMWLPLIKLVQNAYDRIFLYMRVIQSEPDYELPYEIVSQLLESSPAAGKSELKTRVAEILEASPGLRRDIARKYHLLED